MTTPVRMLVVDCPDWPVVAAGFDAGVPVAVMAANEVVACSAAARDAGVEPGLRRRLAQSRCPSLVVAGDDPGRDARAFEPVVVAVESFTPSVEVLRPGVCAFATRGPSRYFGGDDALAAKVTAAVTELCPGVRVGVADGRFAARLAAVHDARVPRGRSAAFLAAFPVEVLDDAGLTHLLRRLGIRTLGDLAQVPAAAVLARFGDDGRRAHRLARGLDDLPLAARVPPPGLTVSVELEPPVTQADTAAFAAKSLADRLCGDLARQGLVVTGVRVEGETEHGDGLARLWHHDAGLGPAALAQRVRWQLDGWFTRSNAPAAGSPCSAWYLSGWCPTAGSSWGSGAGDTTATSGPRGPWPGSRGCSVTPRWPPACAAVGGAPASRSGWSRGVIRSPTSRLRISRGRARSRRRRRPRSIPDPCRPRWSTEPERPSPSPTGRGQRRAGPLPDRGRSMGRRGGVGRPVAGRRTLVGRRRPPPPGPLAAGHRHRRRPPAPGRGVSAEVIP